MALTLSSSIATFGSAFFTIVQGRVGTITLTGNPGYRWTLASTLLVCSDVQPGDTVVLTETINGTPTDYTFPITLQGAPSTLTLSGRPAAASVGSSGMFTPAITGGTAPYYLRALGMLPAGRSVSGLTVSGTYLSSGPHVYALEVSDSLGATARMTVSEYVGGGVAPPVGYAFVTTNSGGNFVTLNSGADRVLVKVN